MASSVQLRRWHAPALHSKSRGQSLAVAHGVGTQRWFDAHASPVPHIVSDVQPGMHVWRFMHVQGGLVQMTGPPPSSMQSATLLHVVGGA